MSKDKYFKKVNRKTNNKKVDYKWVLAISISAFIITVLFSLFSENVIGNVDIIVGVLIVLFFIFLGIIFDMIGIAVTVSDSSVFNSMATKKVSGAKTSLFLIRNAVRVSSFCNDVIGDICGIISGSAGVSIAIKLSSEFNVSLMITSLIVTSVIASLTIGGKAWGKSIAVNNSNGIIYRFAKVLSIFIK